MKGSSEKVQNFRHDSSHQGCHLFRFLRKVSVFLLLFHVLSAVSLVFTFLDRRLSFAYLQLERENSPLFFNKS